MAQNQSPVVFAVTLLLLAATTPLALAQVPPALPIVGDLLTPLPPVNQLLNAITINGTVCCTPTGNCPGGPPLAGLPIALVCRVGGSTVTVVQGITGVDGSFFIVVTNLVNTVLNAVFGIIGGTLPCTVEISLPLSQALCPALNLANSVLSGVPTLVNVVLSPVNGLVGILSVTFRIVAIV